MDMELYENISILKLEWAEDLAHAPHQYCPVCGQSWCYGDEVIATTANPIIKYTGDKEADLLVIWVHKKCVKKLPGDC